MKRAAFTFGAVAVMATPAFADGPCGQDYTGSTACGVNGTSATESGNLVASNETDYSRTTG
jgi:hypothetical protein